MKNDERMNEVFGIECPSCGTAFSEDQIKNALENADGYGRQRILEAKWQGVKIRISVPLYLECKTCQSISQYFFGRGFTK